VFGVVAAYISGPLLVSLRFNVRK